MIDIVQFEVKYELGNQLEKQSAYDKLIAQKQILEESTQEMSDELTRFNT